MLATTLPILLETLLRSGIDLLWFGIIMIILLEAAQISPPQGLSLYVLHGARQETASGGELLRRRRLTTCTLAFYRLWSAWP